MHLETLGIDPSVATVFPASVLRDELRDLPVAVEILDPDATSVRDCEGVVAFGHRDAYLDCGWVHSIQAGVDHFPHGRLRENDVVLTNSSGIHGDTIGETVAGYLLSFARRLHDHVANQQRNEWAQPDWDEAWTIAGERACVVGLGGLGRGVVDRLTGLGLTVDGVRRTPTPEPGVDRVYTPAALADAVANARFVVVSVPLTADTEALIDASILRAMREDAYLVNVARGPVVDQAALVDALRNGEIAGAALDVFETEPLPESSPLWDLDEVIISPHCGAFTRDYPVHIARLLRESVTRIRAGRDPVNRVL
jgi:D-2-hydroxyacid dehydrogenase (NADP+)